jgi:hypothetical protein
MSFDVASAKKDRGRGAYTPLADFDGVELFPVPVCQKILNASRSSVWRLIKSGDLETVKILNRRMGKRPSLIKLIEKGSAFGNEKEARDHD